MSQYDNLLHSKDAQIQLLQRLLIALGVLLAMALIGWARSPSTITLHYPPDLSVGAVQNLGEVPKANVYSFTFYIFQQLNRWPSDGRTDYFERVNSLRNYLTPACFDERMQDYEERDRKNELAGRSRAVWGIPGRGFDTRRVKATSPGSWIVGLDLHVRETYRGERIKDRLIHFPVNVVRYDVDPELNPWGLAIDCYAAAPQRIEVAEEQP